MKMNRWLVMVAVALAMASSATKVEARWFGVGVNIGIPVYPRPYYGPYYGYPYGYYAPPVYVAPPPVVISQPPVYAPAPQPAPVVRSAPPSGYEGVEQVGAPRPAVDAKQQADINRNLQLLNDSDERVRSDSAMDLGRLKAQNALVRESAARALGLIASPRGLNALQTAAQADADRDVRRSAQFSAEVIRANLR
jgi:hypothetical protein